MLNGYPTPNGTGINILGDYQDLRSLYLTIQKISELLYPEDEANPKNILLLGFMYEIRKAYSGFREKEIITLDGYNEIEYFAFKFLWTDTLITSGILKQLSLKCNLNELDKANLYLLEFIVKKALDEYDKVGAIHLKKLLSPKADYEHALLVQINEYINLHFLDQVPSIDRFRGLYALMNQYLSYSANQQKLVASLEEKGRKLKLAPTELTFDDSTFPPDVTW